MKLEKVKEERKKNKHVFLLKDADDVFANTIRRLIAEEVPTLAVEEIEIKENSSALYDEMLGLRLGLTPLKTDLKSYTFKATCSCQGEGCARCELKISLKVNKKGYVYAQEAESTDPKCTFVHDLMPITKLLPKQKVDVLMTATLGRGKEHTKWAPGAIFYKQEMGIKVGSVKNPQKIMDACTDGVFMMKGNSLAVQEEKVQESNLLEYYAELDKGISLIPTGNILLWVESWGQLSCKEMLTTAAEILIEKAEALEKLL